uniref:Dienelactone hydrolase endo-1,3,1,4-beta-D-glucanase n=1 Tax=Mycena chlorophos TaxID=658473 RepID=A0ABQ0LG03_MYCCL|nr:dienelactone hydrolase endo-1,3,1,4-beta-D-glucanase [Mycena chlorophos]
MSSEFTEHCFVAVTHEGTPEGKIQHIGGIESYVATPKEPYNKEKVLVFLTDIFGLALPNNRLLADDFARNGFKTVVPDLFEGDPIPVSPPEGWSRDAWAPKHTPAQVRPIVDKVIAALKAEGYTKFAGAGFCFGARYVFDLAFENTLNVSIVSHPSRLVVPDDLHKYVAESKSPLLINSCEVDSAFPIESQSKADEIFGDGKFAPGYLRTYWPGCNHGFAVRGDMSNPQVKAGKEGAFKASVEWLVMLRPHELNSKGQLMIKLFNVAIRPCDAARLPDDTWLEIMLACTPRELLAMQFVSRRFRRILAENPHTWPAARNNMSPPVPPPPKDIEASGVWSEAAYAQFIFGGGHCVVKPCKKFTMEFPLSFALRIRVCSLHCKNVLAREYDKVGRKIQNAYLTSMGIPGRRGLRKMGQTQRLHFRSWLVYDERELTLHRTYRVSTLAEADQEWWAARALTERRPVKPQVKVLRSVPQLQKEYVLRAKALPKIMANAMALQKWVQEYQVARKETELANVKFVRTTISPREQLQYRKLLNTPTAKAMMKAYGDSLGKIDLRAWCSARAQIIPEYKTALAKSKKERAEKAQASKKDEEVTTQPKPETIPELEPESAPEPVVVIPRQRVRIQLESLGSGLAVPQSRLSRVAATRYHVLKEILLQRKQTRDLEAVKENLSMSRKQARDLEADKENLSMFVGPNLDAKLEEAVGMFSSFPTEEEVLLPRRSWLGDEEDAVGAEGKDDNDSRSNTDCVAADSTLPVDAYDDFDGGSDDSGMMEGLFATSTPRACSPDYVPASHRYGYEDLTDYGSEDEEEGSEM